MSALLHAWFTDRRKSLVKEALLPSVSDNGWRLIVDRLDEAEAERPRRLLRKKLMWLTKASERNGRRMFAMTDPNVCLAGLSHGDALEALGDADIAIQEAAFERLAGLVLCRGSSRLSRFLRRAACAVDSERWGESVAQRMLADSRIMLQTMPAPVFCCTKDVGCTPSKNHAAPRFPRQMKVFLADGARDLAATGKLLDHAHKHIRLHRRGAVPNSRQRHTVRQFSAWTPMSDVGRDPTRQCVLLTVLFNELAPQRIAEYVTCLERNLSHPKIDHVVAFYDRSRDDQGPLHLLGRVSRRPVRLELVAQRPTMGQMVRFAGANFPDHPVILCNADICFDQTLQRLGHLDLRGTMLCLSRWEMTDGQAPRLQGNPFSQDAWIFQPPVPLIPAHYPLGAMRCDGRFAHDAQAAGLAVHDPSLTIRGFHLHASEVRHRADAPKLRGPECPLLPSTLPLLIGSDADDTVYLPAELASLYGQILRIETRGGLPEIVRWRDGREWASWDLHINSPGRYVVWIDQASAAATRRRYVVQADEQCVHGRTVRTGGWWNYRWVRCGAIDLPRAKRVALHLKAATNHGLSMNCRGLVLVPENESRQPPSWWFRRPVGEGLEQLPDVAQAKENAHV